MVAPEVQHIVIVGSGAPAAVAAAATAFSLRGSELKITLIDSPCAVANSSIEVIRGGSSGFHHLLDIDETVLMSRTGAVFGLGTRYRGFRSDGQDAFVPLGSHGRILRLVDFHHYAVKLRAEDGDEDYNAYSLPAAAATAGLFSVPDDGQDAVRKTLQYDIYVDAEGYAKFMREFAADLGAMIITAKIEALELGEEGVIESIVLTDGNQVSGDFFIDCSEDRSLLDRLQTANDFDDWSCWLPCDRVTSLTTKTESQPAQFISVDANDHGWRQRTMLSDFTTDLFAYSSQYVNDAIVEQLLEEDSAGVAATEPRVMEQRAGSYGTHWTANCVAIGPAAVKLEPMEVSGMQLLQSSLLRLLGMLPRKKVSAMLSEEFNRVTREELASARDYQILRYALSNGKTSPFWAQTGQTQLPDSLQSRIDLFMRHGRLTSTDLDFFSKANWVSSFINFGAWPSSYDPLADMIDERRMRLDLRQFRKDVESFAAGIPLGHVGRSYNRS